MKTAIANVIGSLLWLAPLGILGLVYCFLAWRASSNGDMRRAEARLTSAAALARVSVYGGLALLVIGGIAITFFMQGRPR